MAASSTKPVDFELGWTPSLAFDLIPTLHIKFDPPNQSVINALTKATNPVIEIPISGKCPGIPNEIGCTVIWKLKMGNNITDGGSVNAKLKKTADGAFKIVDNQNSNLKIDFFHDKIVGKGNLGYSVKPDIPYHEPVENFPEEFSVDNIIELDPVITSAKIGQKITMKLKTSGIFDHSDIRLHIIENDTGEINNKNAVGIQHTWIKGDRTAWTWAVGFGDDGYGLLTYPEPTEKGDFEYNFTFSARCNDTDEFVEVKKLENLLTNVKKPVLTVFELSYRADTLVFTLVAKGTIVNMAPETQFQVGVNLVSSKLPENACPDTLNKNKCIGLIDQKGNFEIDIEWVFWQKKEKSLNDYMAILYLPQLGNPDLQTNQFLAPVSWVLDYDESKFSSIDGNFNFVGKSSGRWVCSLHSDKPIKSEDIIYSDKVDADFITRVKEIADKFELDPNFLMAAMAFESGGTFSPSIKNAAGSGAVGLIQFMPSTAKTLGTTTTELSKMTAVKQLDYVEKYFNSYKGKIKTLEDLYMAILWPNAIGKPNSYVLFEDGSTTYSQNSGLDKNNDGQITKAEAAQKVRDKYDEGIRLLKK